MFRLVRTFILMAAVFYAGVLFERAGAADTCEGSADWGAYISCAVAEMF
ncbi:MAG: hypothetical protein AAFO58_00420 [Pseudomonadota bacterium]